MYYFSVACIAKNEDLYIEEWVNFHRAVGAEQVFIYDNGSTIPIKHTLAKYIAAGVVTVIDFPGKLMQMSAYNHCLKHYGHTSKWIAFVDCDEFVVPKSKETVSEVLVEFEQYGGLAANWLFFGNSGHVKKPEGLVIENFIMASHKNWCLNNHTKSIVQPAKTLSVGGDPHWFSYKQPFFPVSETHARVNGSVTFGCQGCVTPGAPDDHFCGEVSTNKIQVHHYYTKSEEEFLIRYNGGSSWSPEPTRSNMNGYNHVTRISNIENRDAFKFVDKVKSLYIK